MMMTMIFSEVTYVCPDTYKKRDHLAYLSLLYAIWGNEVRSEALRTMMHRMSQSIEQQSQATIV